MTLKNKTKIIIVGEGSYIGENVYQYFKTMQEEYIVNKIDAINLKPTPDMFKHYDVVFHVAGIAHIKETDENKRLYYEVNRDLAINTAKSAKEAGVKQFILLSTMSVYGKTKGIVTKETEPDPVNAYGYSKLQADNEIFKLQDKTFKFACLRPPMIYGEGCKGNYQLLRKFAIKSPIFPNYYNQRSMLYIGNLCSFIKQIIDEKKYGLFFPQNKEYVETRNLVKLISSYNKKNIYLTKVFNPIIGVMKMNVINKVFGNLVYEKVDCVDTYSFKKSIRLT